MTEIIRRAFLTGLRSVCLLFACATILIHSSAASFAGTINYAGPGIAPGGMTGWMGDTVWYAGVSESNNAMEERFGAPTGVSGDSIDFTPQNFEASVDSPGAGNQESHIVDSQLTFMVIAKPGNAINNMQFSEAGDTTLFGFPNDLVFTSVTAELFVDVVEIDGQPYGGVLNLSESLSFNPSNGDYQIGVDGAPNYATAWSGAATIDIRQALIDMNIPFDLGVTKITVTLDNTLTAAAENGSSAFIKKKDFDGLIITTNVPEPATALLAFAGLAGLGVVRRVGR